MKKIKIESDDEISKTMSEKNIDQCLQPLTEKKHLINRLVAKVREDYLDYGERQPASHLKEPVKINFFEK